MHYVFCPSPHGRLLIAADRDGLRYITFQDGENPRTVGADWAQTCTPVLEEAVAQLTAYFAGRRRVFSLPLAPRGTPFQQAVWRVLAHIPFGETLTYTELAARAGKPRAIRAAGAANGASPLAVVLPCHRVVGKSGGLTGYAGGLSIKRALLHLEGGVFPSRAAPGDVAG